MSRASTLNLAARKSLAGVLQRSKPVISLQSTSAKRPTRDLETAGMHPVEWLAGLLGKVLEGGCRDFDEPHHNLTLAHAAHHASLTRGGLGSDLMPID